MRYFPLIDFAYIVLIVFLGVLSLIALFLAFTCQEEDEGREIREEYPEGIRGKNGRVPLVLIFLYLGFIVWAIVYVAAIGIKGKPF